MLLFKLSVFDCRVAKVGYNSFRKNRQIAVKAAYCYHWLMLSLVNVISHLM